MRKQKKEPKVSDRDEGIYNNKFFGHDITLLRSKKSNAELGYLKINIIDPPIGTVWGTFNNRPTDGRTINEMVSLYEKHLDNCSQDHAMYITLDPTWLVHPDSFLKNVDGYTIDQVPALEFTPDGIRAIKTTGLWMLSGNHRRLALIKYVDKLKEQLEDAKASIDEIAQGKSPDEIAQMGEDVVKELKEEEDRVTALKERIEKSYFWAVKVYDKGESYDDMVCRWHG